ncbi:hypothetical protein [Schaalia vaccimaxillae]|uniref:hypothetical protein n=1 Tax=Schaalia vaccimaxillae TaxID=183916 RepID=UPI0003B4D565|nr:hypothetical protein [Schaalia vaccimaxillae]
MGFLAFTVIPLVVLLLVSLLVLALILLFSTKYSAGTRTVGKTAHMTSTDVALVYHKRSIGWAILIGWMAAFVCSLVWSFIEGPLGVREQVAPGFSLDIGLTVSSGVFGALALAVLTYRESRSPLVDREVRWAALERRRFIDYARGWALALVGIGLASIFGLAIVGLLDSRASAFFFVYGGGAENGTWTGVLGPWFGVGNAAVVGVLLVIELAVAVMAGRNIARRAQSLPAHSAPIDATIRRRSADALIAFLLLGLSLPNILFGLGMAATAGLAMGEQPVLPPSYVGIGVGALGCALVGVVLMVAGTLLLWKQNYDQQDRSRRQEVSK